MRSKINPETDNPVRSSRSSEHKPLRIMKFGGTSVGDASCIQKVVEIIRAASRDGDLVVVVSAMAGVTNRLIDAATKSEAGNHDAVTTIFEELRRQHNSAASALLESPGELHGRTHELLQEGSRLCEDTNRLRQLTPRASDSISSLGERLSTPMIAAALAERGVASKAIDATELIATDSRHGAADPHLERTRQNCQARLRPLLQQGIIPVVTGFIGATAEGALTTLGRGGSDYSATILAAALDADEVIIWTDVDGLMTADPHVVPEARTISEISYREAAELAYFGAKVLHPKTLRPVMQSRIPLQIRNTFTPEQAGTKITPAGPANARVKAVAAISDAALITVRGRDIVEVTQALGHVLTNPSSPGAEVLLISPSHSHNDTCVVVHSSAAKILADALRREFAPDSPYKQDEQVKVDLTVAVVTVVGQHVCTASGLIDRVFNALASEDIHVFPIAQAASECNLSYVVARKDVKAALTTTHREFQLGELDSRPAGIGAAVNGPATWLYE
ncbi:MAG TPA: aspartate kinase [Terriglobales bacterium]|nr:aspartate kinase [Terriglobales bacterium]